MPAEAGGHEIKLPLKFRRLIRRVMNIDGKRERSFRPRAPSLGLLVQKQTGFYCEGEKCTVGENLMKEKKNIL